MILQSNPRKIFELLAGALLVMAGCEGPEAEVPVESREFQITCSGQTDKLVTTDYYGAIEEGGTEGNPTENGHAAAAEVIMRGSYYEVFAVAWVRHSDRLVYVRRYNTWTKDFMGDAQLFSAWRSPGWIRPMGEDDNCVAISPTSVCAWFAWEDDDFDDVNWQAIDHAGAMSTIRYRDGHQPSGDSAKRVIGGTTVRRKLLAYISPDRHSVLSQLLDNYGNPAGLVRTLAIISEPWHAYQTSVSWSSVENRWLVAWSENAYPNTTYNGKIRTRYVDWSGTPAVGTNHIMYCDGNWDYSGCLGKSALAKNVQLYQNNNAIPLVSRFCSCKGFWLTSSASGSASDRYRLHQYEKHAHLNSNGARQGDPFIDGPGGSFSAVTQYSDSSWPFQILTKEISSTVGHYHLQLENNNISNEGTVFFTDYGTPQGFRSAQNTSIALATNGGAGPYGLKLSIVNAKPGGCPP